MSQNFLQDFDLGTLKGHQKFGQKLNCGFQTSSPNIGECLSSRREGSNFQILFVLSKRQIAWTKNFHRCSILWPWKVRAKTESLFPSQPPKMNFFPLGKKRRIFKFYWFVLSKRQIAWTKNFNRSLILWHWRARKSSGKNWIMVSKSAPQKLVNFFLPGEKGGIFKFYWLVLSKRQLAWTKSFHRGLMLWHRRVMKSLTKNQIVVSK